mmetsp:Transcript_16309/g.13972  ORF Transcript_16309/g.13972 Transcript_16309/m.13972 type:complete len:117 (+) Transcript_16309:44-394(+)|eukprot:CAMPEP_0114592504 /NCGR_PEP_ID=MMETSP0125-20121206/14317_1 /TAXON_ID=485358 ORGANISM="Aristerostoma sp., Strain ATCC 50986" /NCGR_SAMPLE_ID=MMETSP0125 /ASSEMBLY_ACC=CAM_ASM_000245 /LENGTH=116 /DNA_ID=CAMNT_0001791187 /DNA_START=38 /DNA_END=388 /DNA_ORIENTATION=-
MLRTNRTTFLVLIIALAVSTLAWDYNTTTEPLTFEYKEASSSSSSSDDQSITSRTNLSSSSEEEDEDSSDSGWIKPDDLTVDFLEIKEGVSEPVKPKKAGQKSIDARSFMQKEKEL